MVTATLDDGLGQGLAIIEKYAVAVGIRLIPLGLMQTPEAVIDACRRHQPDFLGLTILQFDTEDDLTCIANHLPRKTRIVAGGPVFAGDPDFAGRTGTHYAAKNVADFLRSCWMRSADVRSRLPADTTPLFGATVFYLDASDVTKWLQIMRT